MIRYSTEQKENALKMIAEVGVAKTSESMGISVPTLSRWKRESDGNPPSARTPKKASGKSGKKITTPKSATKEATAPAMPAAVEAARALLVEDDSLLQKVKQLEAENASLRETNAKLRTALAALIG